MNRDQAIKAIIDVVLMAEDKQLITAYNFLLHFVTSGEVRV